VNIILVRNMGREYVFGQMGGSMMVHGRMTNNIMKDNILQKME